LFAFDIDDLVGPLQVIYQVAVPVHFLVNGER
jgi:hypothetical protein